MFTGIIQSLGSVSSVSSRKLDAELLIETFFTDLSLGESVAVNGVCLTVAEFTSVGTATFHVSPETLSLTNLGDLRPAHSVNLERALRPLDRLSGHYVQGHVDGLGKIRNLGAEGESYLLEVDVPAALSRYMVTKGSIALNGVSLTINRLSESNGDGVSIAIQLVPHTWKHTNFSQANVGDPVNIEVDILAKYVEKLCR